MKKFVTSFLMLTFLLSINTVAVNAANISSGSKVVNYDNKTGYILTERDLIAPVPDKIDGLTYATNIPKKYPSNVKSLISSYPRIKNQGKYGMCWAFTTIANAEIYMKKNYNKIYDYSELALGYATYHEVNDAFKGLTGDSYNITTNKSFMDFGGATWYAGIRLFNRFGVSNEAVAPYTETNINKVLKSGIKESDLRKNAIHINEIEIANTKKEKDYIKSAIMNNGSVSFSIF